MQAPSIQEIEQDARRGLRVNVGHVLFRDYDWQPYLEVKLLVESVRQLPLRVSAVDLQLSYNGQEVGPLPALTRPRELTEPGEGTEIRMRRDLYPTLVKELKEKGTKECHFQIRGMLVVESPHYSGFIELPVDLTYTRK